ncbi:MAG: PIN domain-containing protein [Acidobacteria bacterium]|nr:PIN domain-containing protein [Acidobacteriota bacterium]
MTEAFLDTSALLRFLIKDDSRKADAVEDLLRTAPEKGIALHILPVVLLEIVWVLEKVYRLERRAIRELLEAIVSTSEVKVMMEDVFLQAVKVYEEKNVKFADAVMGYWGLSQKLSKVFTYDEKDFRRIPGLTVCKPEWPVGR